MSNTKLGYVKLRVGFFNGAKQKAILIDHGHDALVYLLRIYALLAETSCGKLTTSAALGCAGDVFVPLDRARRLLEIFTTPDPRNPDQGTLLEKADDVVFLPGVIEDQTAVAAKRDADAKRKEEFRKRQQADKEAKEKAERERVAAESQKSREAVRSDAAATPYTSSSNSSFSSNSEGGAGETIDRREAKIPDPLKPHEALWAAWEARSALNGRPLNDIYRTQIWASYVGKPDVFKADLENTLSKTKTFNIIPAPDKSEQRQRVNQVSSKHPEKHSTVPSLEKTQKMFADIEAQASSKPIEKILDPAMKAKLEKLKEGKATQ
jgi:hypothetical protein